MPKISVIVPVYNTEKYLNRCLNSLRRQTEKDLEILLLDDGSKDKSLSILESYTKKDSRFKLYSFPSNQGVSLVRNKGISLAKGAYIGFVDSDDFIPPNYFKVLWNQLEKTNTEVVACDDLKGTIYESYSQVDFQDPKIPLAFGGPSCCTHLFTRELIGDDRFIPHCRHEDTAFTFLMHMKSGKLGITSKTKYYHCSDNPMSFNNHLYQTPSNVLDLLRISAFLNDAVEKRETLSCYREKMGYLNMMFAVDIVRLLQELDLLQAKEKQELMTCFYALLQKKQPTFKSYMDDPMMFTMIYELEDQKEEALHSKMQTMSTGECEVHFQKRIQYFQNKYYKSIGKEK